MYRELGIDEKIVNLVEKCEKDCYEEFKKIDEISCYIRLHANRY